MNRKWLRLVFFLIWDVSDRVFGVPVRETAYACAVFADSVVENTWLAGFGPRILRGFGRE
jgi:hypothetical protein